MPLLASPNRGYADGQRISNYDSGVLWSQVNVQSSIGITSPILDVSRYAYIGGFVNETQSQEQLAFTWYTDAAATVFAGRRFFILSSLILPGAQIRLPNLGPFLRVNTNVIAAAQYTFTAQLFGTNRVHPLEFIPQNPNLIDIQSVSIANGANFYYAGDYYAGPMRVWGQIPVSSVNLALQVLNSAGTWDFIDQVQNIASGTDVSPTMIAPPGAWRINATNSGATTAGFFLSVTPPLSGAA